MARELTPAQLVNQILAGYHWSQQGLGKSLNPVVSQFTVSLWKRGERTPTDEHTRQLKILLLKLEERF